MNRKNNAENREIGHVDEYLRERVNGLHECELALVGSFFLPTC